MIRSLVRKWFRWAVLGVSRWRIGLYACEQVLEAVMGRKKRVVYSDIEMTFAAPNRLTEYRVRTFRTKEPETLDWIDTVAEGSVLWDVGANIGLYSVYAAKARKCRVYAFEPSVFNLELLARNIFLNGLQRRVTIVPMPLSGSLGPNLFQMSTLTLGGALSTFGGGFDQTGLPLRSLFEYETIGLSMNEAVELLQVLPPRYIKIDVDGLEHFILRGGDKVLRHVESVLIEINDDFTEQAQESFRCLEEAGLSLYRKCEIEAANMFNQWWVRSSSTGPMST